MDPCDPARALAHAFHCQFECGALLPYPECPHSCPLEEDEGFFELDDYQQSWLVNFLQKQQAYQALAQLRAELAQNLLQQQ